MDTSFALKIDRWADEHRDEFINDVKRMVRFPSVSMPDEGGFAFGTACKECADDFMLMGEEYGFIPENDDYFCASLLMPGDGTESEIAFLGHLDVVPAGDGWDFPPYEPQYIDGYVTGRGSGDNKGPTVMSMYAMRCLRDLGIRLRHSVRLIAGFNEESGMKDVEHYVAQHRRLPEVTIVCDGGWAMCVGEKGKLSARLVQDVTDGNLLDIWGGIAPNAVPDYAYARISGISEHTVATLRARYAGDIFTLSDDGILLIETAGKATHAFHPDDGENAIYRLYSILCDEKLLTGSAAVCIKKFSDCFIDNDGTGLRIKGADDVFGKTTCVGGVVHFENGVLSQSVDARLALEPGIETLVDDFRGRCGELNIGIEDFDVSDGYHRSTEEPVVKMLIDTFNEFFDRKYGTYVMGGGTHARKFPNALPFGPAEMGLGNPFGGQAHGRHESCNIDRLLVSMRVYVMSLIRLDAFLSEGSRENQRTDSIAIVAEKKEKRV